MGQTVKLRRSAVAGKKPINSQLELGELSLNTTDGKLFFAKSGSQGPTVEEIITTNAQNTGSLEIIGSITGSNFTGSFVGDASGLYNIPVSGVTGLSLDKIENGLGTASIDSDGLQVNVRTSITGSLTATEFTGSGLGLTNVPVNISGSSDLGTIYNRQYTKFHFDEASGIKVEGDSTTGVAKIYLSGVAAEGSQTEGRTALLEVTSASSTWTLTHNLGERYPAITVFDSDGNVIIPQNIEAVTANQLIVSFASPQTGTVSATVGGGLPTISGSYGGRVLTVNSDGTRAEWKEGILSSSISFNTYTSSIDGVISSIENTTSSFDGRLDLLELESGSIRTIFNSYTASNTLVNSRQDDRLNAIEIFTGSIDNTYATDADVTALRGTLNSYTSSNNVTNSTQNGRLSSLESESGSIRSTFNSYTSSNNSTNNTQNSRLSSLETKSGSLEGRVGSLETISSSHDGRLDSLETTSGSHNSRINTLESFKTSVDGGLEFTGSNVTIKGNLLVKGTETRVNSTTVDLSDNIISLNGSAASNGGIEVRDNTSPGLLSGSLLWDGTNNYWVGGTKGNEERLLLDSDLTLLDGRLDSIESKTGSFLTSANLSTLEGKVSSLEVESGSIRSTLNSYTTSNDNLNSTQNGRLSSLETESGSIRSTFNTYTSSNNNTNTTQNSRLTLLETSTGSLNLFTGSINTTIKSKINSDNVHSGSYLGTSTTSNLPEGSNLYYTDNRVKGKLNSERVISGSIQVDITSTTNYNLVDGRLDSIESFTASLDNTYATDADVTGLRNDLNSYTSSTDNRIDSIESKTGSFLTTETQTLQDVTDLGSTTSNSITAAGLNTTTTISVSGTNVVDSNRRIYGTGTASNTTPAFTFAGDTDTGLSRIGTDSVGLIAGASRKFYVSGTNAFFQNLTGGLQLSDVPLTVNSDATITGSTLAGSFRKIGGVSTEFLKADGSVDTNTYLTSHPVVSAATSSNNGGRTYIQDILLDQFGHITGITTGTETVVDTNNYTTGVTFNTADGVLTFTRNGSETYTVDLDGRYSLTSHTHDDRYYTETEIERFLDGTTPINGYNKDNWDAAYGWGDHSTFGYLTSYVNNFTTGATFNTTSGVITFTRNNGDTFTVDIDGKYSELGHNHDDRYYTESESDSRFVNSAGDTMTGDLVLRNDTAGDNTIIRDITWNSTAAEGTDDRLAVIRVYTSAGSTTTRGGQLNFYTRQSNSPNFNTMIFDRSGNLYVPTNVYSNSQQLATQTWVTGQNYLTAHPSVSAASSSNNSGRTYIQDILLDSFGHITGITTATETVVNTDTNYYTTGTTWNGTTATLTFTRNDGGTYNVQMLETLSDVTVTGGTYNSGTQTLRLVKSDGSTVDVSGFAVDTDVNWYTTGATFNTSNGIITGTRNDGGTWTVDIDGKYLNLSGGTLYNQTNTTGTSGTSFLTIHNNVGGDLSQQQSFIDFMFTDSNANFFPQVRIGAQVGRDADADAISKEGAGAFVVYTGNGTDEIGGGALTEAMRVSYNGSMTVQNTITATGGNSTQWNAAYGWGDHGTRGYLTAHPSVSAASSSNNSGRTYIQDILLDSFGHITGITTGTETVVNTDTNYYVTGATFNTGDGVITFTRNDGSTVTVDIDGRFTDNDYADAMNQHVRTSDSPTFVSTTLTSTLTAPTIQIGNASFSRSGDQNHVHFVGTALIPNTTTTSSNSSMGNSSYRWSTVYGGYGNFSNSVTANAFAKIGGTSSQFLMADGSVSTNPGWLTSHPSVSAASSSNNSGRTYIQDILLDSFGHITGITTATETVVNTDQYTTGATWNGTTATLTFTRNNGGTYNVQMLETLSDVTVTGGTYNSGTQTLRLTKSDGSTVDVSGFAVDTDVNWYTTGATFNTSNGIITGTRNDGGTWTVDLDGRYLTSYTETDTLDSVTTRGNSTTNDVTVGDFFAVHQSADNATTKAEMLSMAVAKFKPNSLNSGTLAVAQVDSGNSVGLQFTNGAGTADWDMALQPFGGNVGINKINPSGALHVYSGTSERFLISGDVHVQGTTDLNINGDSRRFSFTSGTGTIRTTTANALYLQTNSTTAITIDSSQNVSITGTLSASGYNKTNWDTAYTYSTVGHLPLAGGTLTGDLTTSGNIKGANLQITSTTPTIYFNGTSDGGDYASSDMAIKATPEGLDFYEPEDGNKIHFQILDDIGVNAAFGLQVGGTSVISSSRVLQNVSGNISMFSNDSGYLTTYTDTNYYTTGATFNTSNGIITGTRNDGGTWTVDIDGRYAYTSHTHDDRYFTETESDARYPLSRGSIGTSSTPGDATGFGNNLAAGTYTRNYTGHSGQMIMSHDTGGSVGNVGIEVTYSGDMWVHTNIDSSSWGTKTIWTSRNFTSSDISNWNTAYGWGNHASAGYVTHDYYTTGTTFNSSTGILTFTRNDGGTYTANLLSTLSDVTVTGGTYNSGTQTLRLTKSDGSTVDVSGFAVDTDVNWYTTSASFNATNGIITGTRNDGGTWTADLGNVVYGNAKGTNDSVTTDNDGLDKTGYYTSGGFTTRPSGVANWMYIEHIKLYNSNTAYQKQIGYDTYDNRMWVRTKNNGTWSGWKQIWTSDVFSNNSSNWDAAYTYSTVGHLPLAGGTITGDLIANSKIRSYDSNQGFVARYAAGNDNYAASLYWNTLQLGNNGQNVIYVGKTAANGYLDIYTNVTGDRSITGANLAARFHANGRVSIGTTTDSGYGLTVAGGLNVTSDWVRVSGNQGLYFETYGGGFHMLDTSWVRIWNDKNLYTAGTIQASRFEDANDSAYFLNPNGTSTLHSSYIGRVLMDWDGTDSWFRMQSGNRMRITTTGGTDFIIPNTGDMTYNGNTVWHSGNDGAGSGLDADNLDGSTWESTNKKVRWDSSYGYHGNPRSMAIGFSGGNYGQFGYGLDFTSTSNVHTYAINDIVTRVDMFGGLIVYGAAGGTVGTNITWTETFRARYNESAPTFKGNTIWHAGNDGSGSGLDADTLDGNHASAFAPASHTHSYLPLSGGSLTGNFQVNSGGSYPIQGSSTQKYIYQARNTSNTANSSYGWWWYHANNGDMGFHADAVADIFNLTRTGVATISGNVMWHAGNDGASSGLDADLLDGQHGSYYQAASTAINTGNIGSQSVAFASEAQLINFPDGPRNLTDRNPNWNNRSVSWDFVTAATVGGAGNYAGVMTFSPWDGTSSSTGDSSYQLAFYNVSGVNASGIPGMRLRNGIDTTWKTWYTVWHSGNDGSGSGLDADTVDGIQGSSIITTSNIASQSVSYANSAGNADTVDNLHATSFMRTDAQSTTSGHLIIESNWSNGSTYSDQLTIKGTYPSMSFRSTNADSNVGGTWLIHMDSSGDLQYYSSTDGPTENWTKRMSLFQNGTLQLNGSTVWHTGNDGSGSGLDADLLDGQQGSYYTNAANLTGTIGDVFTPGTRYNIGLIDGNGSQTRDKIRVWDGSEYTIGMKSGYTYGWLGKGTDGYAMSFQMSNTQGRGFWWGDTGHNDSQGAMSLTTDGKATIATSLTVGEGESITAPSSTTLYVKGNTAGSRVFEVYGTQGQLFSVTDDLTGSIFSASDISGIPILDVDASGVVTVDDTLNVYGDVTAYYSSDERLKDNKKNIENALEKVESLNGVEFDWNDKQDVYEGHDIGVIAQEVEKIAPEIVNTRDNGYKAVKYEKLVPLLIEAIKELSNEIKELKNK